MKALSFVLIFLFSSCQIVEEENVWDELTAAEQLLVEAMAEARCREENATSFTSIFTSLQDFSAEFPVGSTVIIDYDVENKLAADSDYGAAIPSLALYKFDILSVAAPLASFHAQLTTNPGDVYLVPYDGAAASLATYWSLIQTQICSASSIYSAFSKVSLSTDAIVYREYISANGDFDSDGETDQRETITTYTISKDYPLFFEYYNKVIEVVTTYDTGDVVKKRETWTPRTSTTATDQHGAAVTDSATCVVANPDPTVDDVNDYEICLTNGIGD